MSTVSVYQRTLKFLLVLLVWERKEDDEEVKFMLPLKMCKYL